MVCLNPFLVKGPGPNGGFEVPCGRCVPCRVAKAREWAVRCVCELGYHDHAHFVTLTYDEEHLVRGYMGHGHLMKSHLQAFFREVRRDYPPRTVKYFACGEYGSDNGRPHYHAIIFGVSDTDSYSRAWKHGIIHIGTVTYDSARYVADYLLKSYEDSDFALHERFLPRPFILLSQGLGASFARDNALQISTLGFRIALSNGALTGVPRYFRKVLKISTDEFRQSVIDAGISKDLFDFWRKRPEMVRNSDCLPVSDTFWFKTVLLPRARKESAKALVGRRAQRESKL